MALSAAGSNEAGYEYLGDKCSSGTILGYTTDSLIGFFGTTPADQPVGATQAAVTETGGTADLSSATVASIHSLANANKTLLNKIRTDLVELGIIKGSA